ncbi:MAG: hypothetical protein PXZ08_11030 [Actinomycetota bacterium]|jgi:hypothetical protein|nr:hypothetical protein [Actinomycetota bacterium]
MLSATFVGSLGALGTTGVMDAGPLTRVCVLATAAAFRGPDAAIDEVLNLGVWGGAAVSGVAAIDRRSANDVAVLDVVNGADLVVLTDGAVLHARSVWRGTALGEALTRSRLVAVGSVGSVLGATMIDPRGGAPTTGMGLFDDVVLSVAAGAEQTTRTRELLGSRYTLVELGARSVLHFDGSWHTRVSDDLVVTRGGRATSL